MAANTVTSTSSTVAAVSTDTVFTATYKASGSERVIFMVKYTKTTNNLAITFDVINASIGTDLYRITKRIANGSCAVYTVTLSATGKYKIPLEKLEAETTIIANLTYAGSDSGEVSVVNFVEG